jgi:hypothetical protein
MTALEKLGNLLEAILNVPPAGNDICLLVDQAPAVGTLPEPQVSWVLMGLLHYRRRKRWAWRVLRSRLRSLLSRPSKGSVSIMDVIENVQEGIVPGLPDWRYSLDGNDSHLVHRGTGEDIHIDALNGPELIPIWAFINHFQVHGDPGPAEQRLRQLFPHGAGCDLALSILKKATVLHPVDEVDFELCGAVTEYTSAVKGFLSRWRHAKATEDRVWLAAWIGDWPAAHDAAVAARNDRLAVRIAPRAAECRMQWLKRLRQRVTKYGLHDDLLLALAEAGDGKLPEYLADALAGQDAAYAALDLVIDDPAWCPSVYKTLTGCRDIWDHVEEKAAHYLARHGHRIGEVIDHFLRRERPPWALLIELALRADHGKLRAFVRRGLRSRDHDNRLTAAAVLVLLRENWTRQELLAVLNRSNNPERTLEVREALRMSGDAEAVQALDRWEASHPEGKPKSVLDSSRMYYQLMFGGCGPRLIQRMHELSEKMSGSDRS